MQGAAAWVSVNVWLAMVMVPVRDAPLLAATSNVMLPAPIRDPLPAILIHAFDDTAVHSHVGLVVTAIVPDPPAALMLCACG